MTPEILVAARRLRTHIAKRKWKLAYAAADVLDMVMARADGADIAYQHTFCHVTNISEAHK